VGGKRNERKKENKWRKGKRAKLELFVNVMLVYILDVEKLFLDY
jgi:hypothetical protein